MINSKTKSKGIVFTIDALLALVLIGLIYLILTTGTHAPSQIKEEKEFEINLKIKDLLLTSKYQQISKLDALENNYSQLISLPGYIIIDSNKKIIDSGKISNDLSLTSQSITYINSSNKKIYIEIGVYYK